MLVRHDVWNRLVFVKKEASDKPCKSAKGLFYAVALSTSRSLKTKMTHCVCPIHNQHYCAMDTGRHFAYWYAKGPDAEAIQKYNDGDEVPLAVEVRF